VFISGTVDENGDSEAIGRQRSAGKLIPADERAED